MKTTTDKLGVYVHYPFCVRKCNYCDFASVGGGADELRSRYISRLKKEISDFSTNGKERVDSLFFGGGTPSLLEGEELCDIIDSIAARLSFDDDCEITVEANPGTVSEDKLRKYAAAGVNRISFGLQSVHENEMKLLGRIHNFDEFLSSYEWAINAGITNINVDLMYGIPDQTEASFRKTLENVIALAPSHISVYGLMIEEGTDFYRRRSELSLPSEDSEANMYYLAAQLLGSYGYQHYEISNYAREGMQSRHNLKYWRAEQYVGFGLGAHSYYGKKRYSAPVNFSEYFAFDKLNYITEDMLDTDGEAYEYAMMRLRLSEGFSLSDYEARFSRSFLDGKRDLVDELSSHGLIRLLGDRISLTEKGFYLSNSILCELI